MVVCALSLILWNVRVRGVNPFSPHTQVREAEKNYVVSGKNTNTGGRKGGFGTRFVDSRLKNDKRAAQKAARKGGGGKRKRNKVVHKRSRKSRK